MALKKKAVWHDDAPAEEGSWREPFDLDMARMQAQAMVQAALEKGVAVVRSVLTADEQARSVRRVVEKIHPDGRIETLDGGE